LCTNSRAVEAYRRRQAGLGRELREKAEVPDGSKRCPDCEEVKPRSAFRANRSNSGWLAAYCTPCFKKRDAETYRRKQEKLGKTVRPKYNVPVGHKRCPRYEEIEAPRAMGSVRLRVLDGYATYCKACRKIQLRDIHLMKNYGLTYEQKQDLIRGSSGSARSVWARRPDHVDHDHKTGKVRGVLCFNCNSGVGKFFDNSHRLRRAITYLEESSWEPFEVLTPRFLVEVDVAALAGYHRPS